MFKDVLHGYGCMKHIVGVFARAIYSLFQGGGSSQRRPGGRARLASGGCGRRGGVGRARGNGRLPAEAAAFGETFVHENVDVIGVATRLGLLRLGFHSLRLPMR